MVQQSSVEQYPDDQAAIRQAALDYMQGWYEGDADRMRRCLHPGLVKLVILRDSQTGAEELRSLTKEHMVSKTQAGEGNEEVPKEKRFYNVTILDIYDDIACVIAESYE